MDTIDVYTRDERPNIELEIGLKTIKSVGNPSETYWISDNIVDKDVLWTSDIDAEHALLYEDRTRWRLIYLNGRDRDHPNGVVSDRVDGKVENMVCKSFLLKKGRVYRIAGDTDVGGYYGVAIRLIPSSIAKLNHDIRKPKRQELSEEEIERAREMLDDDDD